MNIILSQASGANDVLFGKVQVPIAEHVRTKYYEGEKDCLGLKIFNKKKSTSFAQGYGASEAPGKMKPVGEGAMPPVNSIKQRKVKALTNRVWKNNIPLTRELISDASGDMKAVIQNMAPEALNDGYFMAIDDLCFGLLSAAAKNKDAYTINGFEFDTTSYDGEVVFSKKHVGGTNVFKDAFSKEALGAIATEQQNFEDENKKIVGINPDTIIIPNFEAAKDAVWGVIGSEKEPGSANNTFNYQFGLWSVIICPLLNNLVGEDGSFPYFIMDSKYNSKRAGNVFQDREPLEITSHFSRAGVNDWDSYSRFTAGFVDWRQIVVGGVNWGASL